MVNPLRGEAALKGGANPLRGEAPLDIGGASFTLAVDINALCAAEAELKMGVAQIIAFYSQEGAPNITLIRALIWAALQKHHPCTLEQAGEIVADVGIMEAKEALDSALLAAMPPPEEREKKKAKPKPKPNGKSRGIGSAFSKRGRKPGTNPKHSGRKPRAS